jgi:hypothetical protein
MLTTDKILAIPKKIEFIAYPRGAGGDFFSSLIGLAHSDTKPFRTNELYFDLNNTVPKYAYPTYLGNIQDSMKILQKVGHIIDSNEIKVFSQIALSSAFLRLYSKEPVMITASYKSKSFDTRSKNSMTHTILFPNEDQMIKRLQIMLGDKLLIFPMHFYEWSRISIDNFSSSKYWNILNISPRSKRGVKCCNAACVKIFSGHKLHKFEVAHSAYPGKIQFPFIDLLIDNKYNEILDFLKDHYNNELNLEFIDEQIKKYRELRIAPLIK